MPFEFTQAYREGVASVDSTIAFIRTFSFSHSTFPQTYRYAVSDQDLIIEGVTYRAKQLKSSYPSIGSEGNQGMNISVSNVTSQIINIFKTANKTKEPILVEPKNFVANQPTKTASFATKLFVKQVTFGNSDMMLQAGYPDSTNLKLPREKYTTRECPGLR